MRTHSTVAAILAGVALLLSAANFALLVSLLDAKQRIANAARDVASALDETGGFASGTLSTRVAINEVFAIPIETSVPVRTTVTVPVSIPLLGQVVSVSVPIHADVPIQTTLRVPVHVSVPIEVDLGDALIGQAVGKIADAFEALAERL